MEEDFAGLGGWKIYTETQNIYRVREGRTEIRQELDPLNCSPYADSARQCKEEHKNITAWLV